MKETALVFGVLLTALGLYGYFGAPQDKPVAEATTPSQSAAELKIAKTSRSKTALIPAIFGLPLLICGTLAYSQGLRKHAMHAAAGIALLGAALAGGRGLTKVTALFSDDPDVNRRAIWIVLIMALLCALYVVLSARSFIAARRAPEADPTNK